MSNWNQRPWWDQRSVRLNPASDEYQPDATREAEPRHFAVWQASYTAASAVADSATFPDGVYTYKITYVPTQEGLSQRLDDDWLTSSQPCPVSGVWSQAPVEEVVPVYCDLPESEALAEVSNDLASALAKDSLRLREERIVGGLRAWDRHRAFLRSGETTADPNSQVVRGKRHQVW